MGCMQPSSDNVSEQSTTKIKEENSLNDVNGKRKKENKFGRRTSAHNGIMQSIAIKFPHIRRSFLACKRVFDKYAQEKDYVNKSDVKSILIELGAREADLTDSEVEKIIKTANLDGDDKIDFKEFLIAAAVGCFLGYDEQGQSQEFLTLRKGFKVAEEAFNKIDKDGSGEIDFEELKTAFLAMRQDDLILTRLKELDFNGDQTIEFPEFVWGLSAWVGMDDADESDETEVVSDMNLQNNTSKSPDIEAINREHNNLTDNEEA